MTSRHELHTTLPDRQPMLRIVPMPKDTNTNGDVFGGWIMSQVDIAGAIPAIMRAKGRVTTVAVQSFEFHQPVFVGDIVSFYADIVRIGRTSITVNVEVFAQRRPQAEQVIKVTQATLIYVALDENRRPRAVDPEAGEGPEPAVEDEFEFTHVQPAAD